MLLLDVVRQDVSGDGLINQAAVFGNAFSSLIVRIAMSRHNVAVLWPQLPRQVDRRRATASTPRTKGDRKFLLIVATGVVSTI